MMYNTNLGFWVDLNQIAMVSEFLKGRDHHSIKFCILYKYSSQEIWYEYGVFGDSTPYFIQKKMYEAYRKLNEAYDYNEIPKFTTEFYLEMFEDLVESIEEHLINLINEKIKHDAK
ncbi:hypothetical protein EVB32_025 [Rhizobium phage RHph_TM39]|uniref:Uncharacterized protein n=1 Tax=Rhizobium phage RHph_Y65 TaxID=2509785 RepID=A0A7S5R7M4_9CAUD|nr:hypothetical protein PQC17_gp025 [Rhizobium phage RHph_Y65]QIG71859.1 hypothetical protein EVB95_025 [Rhizobium phage RHph_TM2_3B]QIG72583.1 hypothetical protein EVB97_025 [Rhizobium phage RHph_Y65]QIG77013.1 hypothetical protein EVB32_025 [Rhizobium phage RHph_TM39]